MQTILAKIANELLSSGVSRDAAARIACSVVISQLIESGMTMHSAYDAVFGENGWDNLLEVSF